jgi:hypothetical protein
MAHVPIRTLGPAIVRPLLQIAKVCSPEDLLLFLQKEAPKAAASDITLIASVLNEPTLRQRLNDRKKLLETFDEIQSRPRVTRSQRDLDVHLTRQIKTLKAMGLDTSREESLLALSQKNYTERSPLDDVSNLQLLKIILVYEGLKDGKVLASLHDLFEADLADPTTEFGGLVHRVTNSIEIENLEPLVREDNESYQFATNMDAIDALVEEHFHVTQDDDSEYSAPSGSMYLTGGDVSVSRFTGQTGLIITTTGRVPGGWKFNVDVYWIQGDQLYMYDLGEWMAIKTTSIAETLKSKFLFGQLSKPSQPNIRVMPLRRAQRLANTAA